MSIQEIENIIHKTDRNAIRIFWKKFGFAACSAIIFLAGAVVTAIIEKIIR